jgi:NADH:ubiquinone oxidoreductase subunit F (NADH-binding)
VKAKEYRIALKNIDTVNPTSIKDYQAHGGIASLRKTLAIGAEKIMAVENASSSVQRVRW